MGVKISKTLLLEITATTFQIYPECSSQCFSQNYIGNFWNFEFPIYNDFFSRKFAIVPMEKPKSPIVWRMSDRSTFGLVVFKVIKGWFGALAISENTIFKMLLLLHFGFFYSQTFYMCSPLWHKGHFLKFWSLKFTKIIEKKIIEMYQCGRWENEMANIFENG